MEKKEQPVHQVTVLESLMSVLPFVGIVLAIKRGRYKGLSGFLYMVFASIYSIGFVVALYKLLK